VDLLIAIDNDRLVGVVNAGDGIAPDHLPHIFELFLPGGFRQACLDGGTGSPFYL
jgi:signal transduction histidine kinase